MSIQNFGLSEGPPHIPGSILNRIQTRRYHILGRGCRFFFSGKLYLTLEAGESSSPFGLPPALALWVKVGLLPQADSPRPLSLTQPLLADVVRSRGVIDAAVVPDGEIINVVPSVAHLQIMVLDDQLDKPV